MSVQIPGSLRLLSLYRHYIHIQWGKSPHLIFFRLQMNSKNGIVFLLLFLAIWLVYTDAIIIPLSSRIKRRTRTKAIKKPSTTVPPNAITKMIQSGVKPNNSKVRSLTSMIDPQGKITLKSFSDQPNFTLPIYRILCIICGRF